MRLCWDESKRQKTLNERQLDFADFPAFFDSRLISIHQDTRHKQEARYIVAGYLHGRFTVAV